MSGSAKPLHVKLREKRNRPPEGQPWVWFTEELLASDAFRTAPIRTLRFVFRVVIEQMAHAGTENGNLVVTFKDCIAWGIPRKHVKEAQADAIKRGLVYRTQKGKASAGRGRRPSIFGLGWLPHHDGGSASNRWKAWKPQPLPPDGSLKSSSYGGTKFNGRGRPKKMGGRAIKFPMGVPAKVPTGVPGEMFFDPRVREIKLRLIEKRRKREERL